MPQEPQIKKKPRVYTVPEFAAKIKAEFPEYKELSDDDLTMRVLKRHPRLRDRVDLGSASAAEAQVARTKTQFEKAASALMSAAGKQFNPDVTPGTDYFRPLTAAEQAAKKRGEPIIISEAAKEAPIAPELTSRPRQVTPAPVSLAPVIQSRLEQIQREQRQRELQAKVEQARQIRQRAPRGLFLPPGERNVGPAYKPKFGAGETYKQIPRIDTSVPRNTAEWLVESTSEPQLTFEQDRAARALAQKQMERLRGRQGAASDFGGEEYKNFLLQNRSLDNPNMREQFLTLKAQQQVAKHGSIMGAMLAEDEESARQARVAKMGTPEYLAQIPKSAVGGLAGGAGTSLKGLALVSKALANKIMDTGGLETRDTYTYRLGEYISQLGKDNPIFKSNPDLEKEFIVGKAPDTIGQSVIFLLGGWATKSPKLAVSVLGGTLTAGDAYDEVRALGGSEDEAVRAGLIAGSILGPTELFGMRGAMRAIEGTAAETTLKAALKTALTEGRRDIVENSVQEFGQELGQGLITGNPRSLAELAEAGILGAVGGVQTVPTSLAASAIESRKVAKPLLDYAKASPLTTPEEKTKLEKLTEPTAEDVQAVLRGETSTTPSVEAKEVRPESRPVEAVSSSVGLKPETRTENIGISEPTVEKPQQIAPDLIAETRTTKPDEIIPEIIPVPTTKPSIATPAEVKTQPSATESQLTTAKEVKDVTQEAAPVSLETPTQVQKGEAVSAEAVSPKTVKTETREAKPPPRTELQSEVARFAPSSEGEKQAIPAKLTEWGTRLKSIVQSKSLNDLQALSDEMASAKDDPRVARLRGRVAATLATLRQPTIQEPTEQAPVAPATGTARKPPATSRVTKTRQEFVSERMRALGENEDPIVAQRNAISEHDYAVRQAVKKGTFNDLVPDRQRALAVLKSLGQRVPNSIKREIAMLEGKAYEVTTKPKRHVGRPRSKPEVNDLATEIRAHGGIRPTENFKGEVERLRQSGKQGLVNPNGLTAEAMARVLSELDYGRDVWWEPNRLGGMQADYGVDANAFLDAAVESASGYRPHHSSAYEAIEEDPDMQAWRAIEQDEDSVELLERVQSGHATASDIFEITTTLQEHGISEQGLREFLRSLDEQIRAEVPPPSEADEEGYTFAEDGTLIDPEGNPLFSHQLGLPSEGLTQQEAPRPQTDQRDRLRREQQEREEAADPLRAAALRVLADIKRRGMTVDEYARQGDLFGPGPSAEEIKLLKELEGKEVKPESTQATMFARGETATPSQITVEGNRVSLDAEGAKLLSDAYRKSGHLSPQDRNIRGSHEKNPARLAKTLDRMAEKGREGAAELADAVRKAAKSGKAEVVLFSSEGARKHELFHESSARANRALQDRHADMDSLTENNTFSQMYRRLTALGYDKFNMPALVEEAAAHIAEGRYDQLGITREEAVEWMYKWFKSFEAKNPNVNPREFQELADEAEKARKRVYEAAGRQPQPDQTIPSVQEGREGGDRESIAAARGDNAEQQTIKDLESRVVETEGFTDWLSDLMEGNKAEIDEAMQDDFLRLGYVEDYLRDAHSILVREDGLIEFYRLDDEARDIIGDNPVIVHHHTSDAILPQIRREGLKRTDSAHNAYQNSKAGVYVTTEVSGPAVKGYHRSATSNLGGDEITLGIRTTLHELTEDPDDVDISSGPLQYVLPYVSPQDIVEITRGSKTEQFHDPNILMARSDDPWADLQEGREGGDRESIAAARASGDITESEAFKRWFGDSKVVDKEGKPLVVYHGTDATFDVPSGRVYLTDDKDSATQYGERVLPLYAAIRHPYTIAEDGGEEFYDILEQNDIEPADNFFEQIGDQDVINVFRGLGYDGFITEGDSPDFGKTTHTTYVVFSPSQIKSATGNRGTFDPNDPNILMARSDDPWADLADLAAEFEQIANEPELAPGEKETKQSRLAEGVEAKAIEGKLTAGFHGLPEYETVKVADQARMAADLLRNDPEGARSIALGQSLPQGNLLPESVFVAVENKALAEGNVALLRDLATASTLSLEATGMGQRIRMLAERNPYSPVTAMREIQNVREARAKKKMGAKFKERVITEIKTEVRKKAPKARDWRAFLEEIRCK